MYNMTVPDTLSLEVFQMQLHLDYLLELELAFMFPPQTAIKVAELEMAISFALRELDEAVKLEQLNFFLRVGNLRLSV